MFWLLVVMVIGIEGTTHVYIPMPNRETCITASIVAEVQAVGNDRTGHSLREGAARLTEIVT